MSENGCADTRLFRAGSAEPPQVLEAKRQMQRETRSADSDPLAGISGFVEDHFLAGELVLSYLVIRG